MAIKFLGLKNDEQAYFALNILEKLDQKIVVLENSESRPEKDDHSNDILVGVFTTPNPKLLRRGHLSRVASHKVMEYSPSWADSCQFLIAIRQTFGKKSRPKEMCKEWIKIVSNLTTIDLSKLTPWGSLPTASNNFGLYQQWITKHLGLDPGKLGIRFIAPVNNLSISETKEIRQALRNKKDKRLTDRVIRLAQKTTNKPSAIESVIETGEKLIDLTKGKRLGIESGQEFEMILSCLWRALAGEQLIIIAPLCPAWAYGEGGYTFSGLEDNSRGIFYEKMIREFLHLIGFLEKLGVEYKLLAWIADIEWFSMNDYSDILAKEKFMKTIAQQNEMIRLDLEHRRIKGRVMPLLKLVSEADYLAEATTQRSAYDQLLQTSVAAQKHFENTLKIKENSYQKRFGVPVVPHNPHPKIKDGLTKDIIAHLAPVAVFKRLFSNLNFMFFLEAEPFTQLYQDVPYISWHPQGSSDYDPRSAPGYQSPFGPDQN